MRNSGDSKSQPFQEVLLKKGMKTFKLEEDGKFLFVFKKRVSRICLYIMGITKYRGRNCRDSKDRLKCRRHFLKKLKGVGFLVSSDARLVCAGAGSDYKYEDDFTKEQFFCLKMLRN